MSRRRAVWATAAVAALALAGCGEEAKPLPVAGGVPASPSPRPTISEPPFNPATEPFRWAEEPSSLCNEGVAVALVRGLTPREALTMLAPDAQTSVQSAAAVRKWAQKFDYRNYATALEAGPLRGWTWIVELNGYRAVDGDNATRLSTKGAAYVYYCNVELDMEFAYSRGGRMVRAFDPIGGYMSPIGAPLVEEQGLLFGGVHAPSSAMALLQRLTHVRVTKNDIQDPAGRLAVGLHPG